VSPSRLRADCRAAYLLRVLSDLESGTARQTWFLALARAADRRLLEFLDTRPAPLLSDRLLARLLPALSPVWRWLLLYRLRVPGLLPYRLAASQPLPPALARHWPRTDVALLAAAFDGLWINLCLLAAMAGVSHGGGLPLVVGIACMAFGGVFVALRCLFHSTAALARQNLLLDEPLEWSAQEEEASGDLPEWLQHIGIDAAQAPVLAAQLLADPDRHLEPALCRRMGLVPAPRVRPFHRASAMLLAFAAAALLPMLPFVWLPPRYRLFAMLLTGMAALAAIGWRRAQLDRAPPAEAAARSAIIGGASAGLAFAAGWGLSWLFNL